MTQNELPVGWIKCKFFDVGYLQNGYAFNSKSYKDEGTNLIRISDIQNDTVSCDNCVKVTEQVDKCFEIHQGDFLLAMSGATTGKTGVYKEEKVALLNQRVGNLKIYDKEILLPAFRNYFISDKRKVIEKLAYGGAQPNISKAMIENLDILLPPLAEQKRIVGKIEELFAEVDKGIDLLKQKQAELKKYRQSVLSAAFSGKLYKTTEWKETNLGSVCEKISKRRETKDENEKFKYIDISSINNKTLRIETPLLTNGKEAPSRARQIVKTGDVVFSTVRTYLMNIGYVSEELDNQIASTGFCVIRGIKNVLNGKFIFYKSISQEFLKPLNQMQYGAVYPAVRDKDVFAQNILLPTFSEQEQIVTEIEQRFEQADVLEQSIAGALDNAEKLKQSILKKAFEGKLVPQDPNDEPASVLLDRIKSEQKKGKKK